MSFKAAQIEETSWRRPPSGDLATRRYYREQADRYAAQTLAMSMSATLGQFLDLCPVGPILDLGCGAGRDLRDMSRAGKTAFGLDLSPELAAGAARLAGAPVVVADLMQIPFPNGSMAGVWASASLLHTPRQHTLDALTEITRILAPGGALFTSVKSGLGDYRAADGRWFALHQLEDWVKHLEAAGLRVESADLGQGASTARPGADVWISCFARRA